MTGKAKILLLFALTGYPLLVLSQSDTTRTDSVTREYELRGTVVRANRGTKSRWRVENTELIGQMQLKRAACCNLGESFTANPSVDVSYADAATGARQIKLLGLSGTYVQMLTENVPNLRGASLPYALGFVPGPWMQSIQVSKGAASVRNGYESITGQINIEYLKPQTTDGVRANLFLDSKLRTEANADANIHLNDRLSTSLLLHFEDRQREHDGNGDGFADMPKIRQYNLMHRWAYVSPNFISQLSLRALHDKRESGTTHRHDNMAPYRVEVTNRRYEAQWKNAYLWDNDHNASLALMLHGSWHEADNSFGTTLYDVRQRNGFAQLLYETDLTPAHNLAVGASVNHDEYKEEMAGDLLHGNAGTDRETTGGAYVQYTGKWKDKLTVMPGIRWDYSGRYGGFFTPRLHVKYTPAQQLTLRASAGKGYRSPHALAENAQMLACGRTVHADIDLKQEEAWNYGIAASLHFPLFGKEMELNTEYYYTDFLQQIVMNVDGNRGPHTITFENLQGKSYSHTVQIDATYPPFPGATVTAAFRYNDARTTYDGVLRRRPLTSRYKGLLTISYKTPTELWQMDITAQLHGKGELYDHSTYPTYFQLQAQLTREFRLFSIYAGGENLTNYRIPTPVIHAENPWSPAFDATQIWGPTEGAMFYVGVRFKLEKL